MIQTVVILNSTLKEIQRDLFLLLTTRKFLLTYAENLIYSRRLNIAANYLVDNVKIMEQYIIMFRSGELNRSLVSPEMLIIELVNIQKQLPPSIKLPEDPTQNIWHYYNFLSVSHTTHNNKIIKIIILIKLQLIDNDSSLDLSRIYSLPLFNPSINKALTYQLEANTLAVSKDGNYATFCTESEFLECTLASRHFCNIRSALYHMQSYEMCIISLFLKDEIAIDENCEMKVTNITGPLALYLDESTWVIATTDTEQIEVTCSL